MQQKCYNDQNNRQSRTAKELYVKLGLREIECFKAQSDEGYEQI